MRHKSLYVGLAVAAVVVLAAGTVLAGRAMWGPERMKAYALEHLDEALEDQPLSQQQQEAIGAAIDRAVAARAARRGEHKAMLEQVLAAFEGEELDVAALEKIQATHVEQMRQGLLPVLQEVHDVLSAAQRRAIVAYVRSHAQPGRGWGHGWGHGRGGGCGE